MKLRFLCGKHRSTLFSDRQKADYCWHIWMKTADYYCQMGEAEKAVAFLGCAYELAEHALSGGQSNYQLAISRFTYSSAKLAQAYSELGQQKVGALVMKNASKRLERELPAPGLSTWIMSCINNLLISHNDRNAVESLRKACLCS